MHIFISYAKKDTPVIARQLHDELNALPDVTAWIDEEIEGGEEWARRIKHEIDRCDWFIALISPDVNRETRPPSFVLNEIYHAQRKQKDILPVLAQPTEMLFELLAYHHIDISQNEVGVGVARVVEEVCKRVGLAPPQTKPRSVDLMPPPFEWIEIPAGRVKLEAGGYFEHKTDFDVPAFMISKYPVTNAQYAKFIDADGYFERKWWTAAGWQARERNKWKEPLFWQDSQWNAADYPVIGVSWYEAIAFCHWLSMATGENVLLPTDQQWSRAARGDDGRAYPWGNEKPNEELCNFDEKIGHTTPVTQFPKGASAYGVMDMSGNVSEWCLTEWETGSPDIQGYALRGARGRSWGVSNPDEMRVAARIGQDPGKRTHHLGFRIARTR